MNAEDLVAYVRPRVSDVVVARNEVSAVVGRDGLLEALAAFRDDPALSLGFLSSVTATDWPGRRPRFWLAYELYSLQYSHRLRVKVGLPEDDAHVPSVARMFPTADWHEREVFDFYGIVFDGHPGLQRILMPEDWEGYPLRKDEPLGGVRTQYRGAFVPPVDERMG